MPATGASSRTGNSVGLAVFFFWAGDAPGLSTFFRRSHIE